MNVAIVFMLEKLVIEPARRLAAAIDVVKGRPHGTAHRVAIISGLFLLASLAMGMLGTRSGAGIVAGFVGVVVIFWYLGVQKRARSRQIDRGELIASGRAEPTPDERRSRFPWLAIIAGAAFIVACGWIAGWYGEARVRGGFDERELAIGRLIFVVLVLIAVVAAVVVWVRRRSSRGEIATSAGQSPIAADAAASAIQQVRYPATTREAPGQSPADDASGESGAKTKGRAAFHGLNMRSEGRPPRGPQIGARRPPESDAPTNGTAGVENSSQRAKLHRWAQTAGALFARIDTDRSYQLGTGFIFMLVVQQLASASIEDAKAKGSSLLRGLAGDRLEQARFLAVSNGESRIAARQAFGAGVWGLVTTALDCKLLRTTDDVMRLAAEQSNTIFSRLDRYLRMYVEASPEELRRYGMDKAARAADRPAVEKPRWRWPWAR